MLPIKWKFIDESDVQKKEVLFWKISVQRIVDKILMTLDAPVSQILEEVHIGVAIAKCQVDVLFKVYQETTLQPPEKPGKTSAFKYGFIRRVSGPFNVCFIFPIHDFVQVGFIQEDSAGGKGQEVQPWFHEQMNRMIPHLKQGVLSTKTQLNAWNRLIITETEKSGGIDRGGFQPTVLITRVPKTQPDAGGEIIIPLHTPIQLHGVDLVLVIVCRTDRTLQLKAVLSKPECGK